MRAALALPLVSFVLLAGCSPTADDGPESVPAADPTSTATPADTMTEPAIEGADPCDLLSEQEAATLAGAPVDRPSPGTTGGMPNCQWLTGDGVFVQTVAVPAPVWAQSLPEILRLVEASGLAGDGEDLEKFRAGAELVEGGEDLDPDAACSLFSTMLELQGRPEGSSTIVTVVPDPGSPQAVTAQACSRGRFTSVLVGDATGLQGALPDSQVARTLTEVHRRHLG
ncbi:DUF3558 family protein [Nocardioides sp. GCM10027113]|uniref:DUF3558 family protein n=1 Tax=unclassified Nocardioides TaxID=2615069 RepID=UPI003608F3BF